MNRSNTNNKQVVAIVSLLFIVFLAYGLHAANQHRAYHTCEDRVLSQHWDVSNDVQWNAYLRALGD